MLCHSYISAEYSVQCYCSSGIRIHLRTGWYKICWRCTAYPTTSNVSPTKYVQTIHIVNRPANVIVTSWILAWFLPSDPQVSQNKLPVNSCYSCLFLQHVWRGRPARRAEKVDPVLQRRHGHHLRDGVQQLQPRAEGRPESEPPQRITRPLQEHLEQPVGGGEYM